VPYACALPTAEQPLRVAEFDELFAGSVREVTREGPTGVRLDLDPVPRVAARAADLMARETGCCSFFGFTLVADGGRLTLTITVSPGHTGVLSALAERAAGLAAPR
jgi:hypothetical protein